jgi:hypothetical protein
MQPPCDGATTGRPRRLDGAERVLQPLDVPKPRFGGAAGIVGWRELARRKFEVEPAEKCRPRPERGCSAPGGRPEAPEGLADRGEHLAVHGVELLLAGELDMATWPSSDTAILSLPICALPPLIIRE